MTERPILFSAEMVRAILAGRKTQTRRVIKPVPTFNGGGTCHDADALQQDYVEPHWVFPKICKYGAPGDTLWVRETWCLKQPLRFPSVHYRADGEHVVLDDGDGFTAVNKDGSEKSPWRSSIHMPRWASRITLRITDVRVERLQDISEGDARAEGCPYPPEWAGRFMDRDETAKTWFKSLWNHIHGPDAWQENPWVWVISFERVKP
jgi:hypothetical protein